MEALNQKNSLNIRLLSSNNILLHNQEFKLYEIAQGNKNEIKTIFTTNRMREAHLNASEIFSKEAQSFELILNQSSVYKNKPIYNHRFLLRSYEYGHWCEIKFERKADKGPINSIRLKSKEFTLENNEKIARNFYTFGDIVEFEAIYEDTKIKEEQIKWGYVFIQDKNTLDKLNKNQLTNDKKESSLFDEEILKDCFYIEKEEDKALLSSSIIYRHLDNKAYCGKSLSLQLPNPKDTQEQKALLVFAYKEIPNYNASYLIRINDYPQITIDCTLAETHRAIKDLQKPSDIINNSLYFQRFDIKNDVFLPHLGLSKFDAFSLQNSIQHEKEVLDKFHSNPKYKQNFALYSIAGTFNILYIPSLIQITRVTRFYNYHSLYAACKKVHAFIIDTVNFNNNGSDQLIGAWDYEKVGFDLYNSIMQYRNTKFHFKYTSPKSFLFPLYNSDFLKTKQYFNLGLDFFLYSSTFLDMDFSHTQMQDTAFIVRK
ncbi:hypothetical protein WOA44_001788 [Campylobacter jejuni]|nr:hypothetical protein [Campylobacter jejuni]GKY28534.1 hypothetical protein THJ062_18020 [Campylobacter jejuni]HEF7505796.1 hypothetical protein [Campylobacter jejuni]HEH3967794.1 hypothetical protein [Campylobacter jejuni]